VAAAIVFALAQVAGMALAVQSAWPRRLGRARDIGVDARSKTRAIRHFDARAERYDVLVSRGPLRFLRVRERQAVLDLARLHDPSKRTVIDVGCGAGFYSRAAKEAGKWVHAVDAAPAMVQRVRPHVDVAEVADIETFTPNRTYDVVICSGVLDFVTQPERAFDNLCRLCAPGGRLVVLLPRAGAGSLIYRLEKRLQRLEVNVYRRARLARWASRRGLVLTGAAHPLPFNMALLFESPRSRTPAVRQRRR
jgi:SAM-dependent methyltransferase